MLKKERSKPLQLNKERLKPLQLNKESSKYFRKNPICVKISFSCIQFEFDFAVKCHSFAQGMPIGKLTEFVVQKNGCLIAIKDIIQSNCFVLVIF